MDSSLKDTYRRFPTSNVYGNGVYTYVLFCLDNSTGNRTKYEIKADCLNNALIVASQVFGQVYNYMVLDDTSLEVYFVSYPTYITYLFI